MTITFECADPEKGIKAITGFKGVCAPWKKSYDFMRKYCPNFFQKTSLENVKADLVRLSKLVDKDCCSEVVNDYPEYESSILNLQEELDHFQCVRHSRQVLSLFFENQFARWSFSHSADKIKEGNFPVVVDRLASLFLWKQLIVYHHAYPLVEGAYFCRFSDSDIRLRKSGWHPYATETIDVFQKQSELLCGFKENNEAWSYIGSRIDQLVMSNALGVDSDIDKQFVKFLNFDVSTVKWLKDRNVRTVLLKSIPQMPKYILNYLMPRMRKKAGSGFGGLPQVLMLNLTVDPSVLSLGKRSHRGKEKKISGYDKMLMDLWWFMLSFAIEVYFFKCIGKVGGTVLSYQIGKIDFYFRWRGYCENGDVGKKYDDVYLFFCRIPELVQNVSMKFERKPSVEGLDLVIEKTKSLFEKYVLSNRDVCTYHEKHNYDWGDQSLFLTQVSKIANCSYMQV